MSERDVLTHFREMLEEWRDLSRFARIQAERSGGKLKAPAWAARQIEQTINRYLDKEEAVTEAKALFVVKSIREYEDKRIAFLVPAHPDQMAYNEARSLGGRVEDLDLVPDAIYDQWYDDMLPAYEFTSTVRDQETATGPFKSGLEGITVRLGESQPWAVGDVVELRASVVGREEDLTAPLRNAPREKEDAA